MPAAQPGPRPACDGAPTSRRTRWSSEPPVAASTRRPEVPLSSSRSASACAYAYGIAAQADGEIVAAVLALGANPPRQPPDGRVIEQQRLDERLQQVDEIVVPADVRELVRQDRLELLGATAPPARWPAAARRAAASRSPSARRRRADSSSRTARPMCSWRASVRAVLLPACPPPATPDAASSRCTHSHPLASRSDSSRTPHIHATDEQRQPRHE